MNLFISSFKKNRIILSVFSAFILLILIEIIRPVQIDPLKANKYAEQKFWVHKTHHKGVYDVVIVGDSRAYRGISPKTVSDNLNPQTNSSVFNMGYSSLGLTPQVFELARSRLDSNSKNKILIIALTPLSLMTRSFRNEHLNQEIKRDAEDKWLKLNYWPKYELLKQEAKNFLPVVFKPREPKTYYYQDFHQDGWISSWVEPENKNEAIESYKKLFAEDNYANDAIEIIKSEILKFKELNTQVFVFRMPSSPEMEYLENTLGKFNVDEVKQALLSINAIWLEFDSLNYHSYDASHLHKDSAVKFSKDLALAISQKLNALR